MTEIYLIRHGEAEGNVFRRLHGHYDGLLTPRGMQQVKCLEKRFENVHIDACYSSDLTRTSLTARSIYVPKGLKLRRDPRFREIDCGPWEDHPYGWLELHYPEEMHRFNYIPTEWKVEGAETFDQYSQRFYEGVVDAALENDGGTIAIFAHGCVIRSLLMREFFGNDVSKLPYSDNTGVSKLIYDKGKFTYEFVNDNSHLPEELSTFFIQRWWRETGRRKDVNFHYRPYESGMHLAEGVQVPQLDEQGLGLVAILHGEAVGIVSMAAAEGDCGRVLGIGLKPDMDGRYYGDQLLGCAFSHFRQLGCKNLNLAPGWYPDDIVARYEFDPVTRIRNIDTHIFNWEE